MRSAYISVKSLLLSAAAVLCLFALPAQAQDPKCFVLCAPALKIEPTITWENLFKAPRIAETDDQGKTTNTKLRRERIFETVLAVDVPSTIPRTSFVFEVIGRPFVKGSSPELETEVNFKWLRS